MATLGRPALGAGTAAVSSFALERALTPRLRSVTTWTIGEAAEKCGLSQHTLRWYERIGLLDPVDRGGDGRRRSSDGDLDWLSLLTKLRATGMPVREMLRCAELVRSSAGHQERAELLRRHRMQVRRISPASGNASSYSTPRSPTTTAAWPRPCTRACPERERPAHVRPGSDAVHPITAVTGARC
jgi:DNA-binding transcriptional MerR regulator